MSQRVPAVTYIASLSISAVAAAFLIWLVYFKPKVATEVSWAHWLPYCNALFNSCAAYQLVKGWRSIRGKQRQQHRYHMLMALLFSALFLVSYILRYSLLGDTRFPDLGWIRQLYLTILISHVGLSILILPVILITFALALTGKFAVHPKFGRIALPIWLYVSVTGVVIVAFLKFSGALP